MTFNENRQTAAYTRPQRTSCGAKPNYTLNRTRSYAYLPLHEEQHFHRWYVLMSLVVL